MNQAAETVTTTLKTLEEAVADLEKNTLSPEDVKQLSDSVKEFVDSNQTEKLAEKAMEVYDIYLPYNHMFTEAAKRGMSRQVNELMPPRIIKNVTTLNKTVYDKIEYFGAIAVGEKAIYDAAKRVAQTLNALALQGYITGSLTRLGMVRLASEPFEMEKFALFSYVALTEDGQKFVEGDKPSTLFDGGNLPTCIVRDQSS